MLYSAPRGFLRLWGMPRQRQPRRKLADSQAHMHQDQSSEELVLVWRYSVLRRTGACASPGFVRAYLGCGRRSSSRLCDRVGRASSLAWAMWEIVAGVQWKLLGHT